MTYGNGLSPGRETAGHMAAGPSGRDATAPAPDPTLSLLASGIMAVLFPTASPSPSLQAASILHHRPAALFPSDDCG